jgi:hypothetical protein
VGTRNLNSESAFKTGNNDPQEVIIADDVDRNDCDDGTGAPDQELEGGELDDEVKELDDNVKISNLLIFPASISSYCFLYLSMSYSHLCAFPHPVLLLFLVRAFISPLPMSISVSPTSIVPPRIFISQVIWCANNYKGGEVCALAYTVHTERHSETQTPI